MAVIPLVGCVPALIYDYGIVDHKVRFETWANGLIGTRYDKPYFNTISRSIAKWGYGILQSSESHGNTTDYIFRQEFECFIAVTVDTNSGVISSWRYVGQPEKCWVHVPSA